MDIVAKSKDKIFASPNFLDYTLSHLLSDERVRCQPHQILCLRLKLGKPVPSLFININRRCHAVETLADSGDWPIDAGT